MNTPHEGHNFGIKSSPLGPRTHHTVVRSTKQLINLSYYDAMKFTKKNTSHLNDQQLWSNTPTSDHVTTWIEGLIKKELDLVEDYDLMRIDQDTWYTKFKGQRNLSDKWNKIPVFERVRKIVKSPSGALACSCGLADRFRLPCCHILLVNNGEIKLNDVCVRNTVLYAQQYGDSKYKDETVQFEEQISNYHGPKYHVSD